MREIYDILAAVQESSGQPSVLATIVRTRGSSYRKPGARMLVLPDGSTIGSISGGCLEHDVRAKAEHVLRSGQPELAVFDMTTPDDDLWGYGQGCNGVISVLLEPVLSPKDVDCFSTFSNAVHKRMRSVLVIVFRVDGEVKVPVGTKIVLSEDGTVVETLRAPDITAALVEEASRALEERSSRCAEIQLTGGRIEAFLEVIQPPLRLVIFGAGNDAVPLHKMAGELGWDVQVADHRQALVTKDRFPYANALLAESPENLVRQVSADTRTAAVIMTHQFEKDLIYLAHCLRTPVPYIGLLGPARRGELLLQRLGERKLTLTNGDRHRLYSPVGVNIGAESPEEIAIAIIAEIQAVMNARPGGFLKDRRGPIHSP